ncbi:hypothetical protein EJ02DRAFT_358164 [Clathrospora elynae]|uniref:Uncharacterized protein n=1 Tax=Clathrospora elynae TaxID=706981 RepID=A0A6A5SHI2_9PLEO|nr:hypothetical protein EJ02DRAFT_358164 [Clathrospora elynae]
MARERDEHLSRRAAFIPRSAYDDVGLAGQATDTGTGSSLLDTAGYRNVNIDIPLNSQSSLHMELISLHDHTRTSSPCTHQTSDSDAGTVQEALQEYVELDATGHNRQAQQSPRKSLPSHWLPKSAGPNLATAQRAKERTHKTGSPIEVKTLRGTRSSLDLGKTHSRDGATFLTKEALAAVESNIVSPTSPLSPSRLRRSPSKPTKPVWGSPNGSPRSHARATIRMSPTKSTYLHAESAHARAPSSVGTSTGGQSFHTAEGSPVRSPAGTEHSYQSIAENPQKVEISALDLVADNEDIQASGSRPPALKATTEGKASSMKPRLTINIPLDAGSSDEQKLASTSTSATAISTASVSPFSLSSWSLSSPVQASRIPRVATASKAGNAAQRSNLKRAQSVRLLISKDTIPQESAAEPHEVPLPETPAAASLRHVRTVDSSGTTPIISRTSGTQQAPLSDAKASENTDTPPAHTASPADQADARTFDPMEIDSYELLEHVPLGPANVSGHTSRATSNTTVKATPAVRDPFLMDPAIIYSRKNSDVFGMTLNRSIITPPLTVMMAHKMNAGTLHLNAIQADAASIAANRTTSATSNTSLALGKTDRYVPSIRKQEGSEHSTQSVMGSDLRATAREFVPQAAPTTDPVIATAEATSPVLPQDISGFPVDISMLDRNGVPFLYYMYPVHLAYEQGFRNGRAKSPKKLKHKKQRSSISSPISDQQHFSKAVPIMGASPATPLSTAATQRQTSAEMMPPPPIPAHRHQEDPKRENSNPGLQMQISEMKISKEAPSASFTSQLDMIADQGALRDRTNYNTPRSYPIDLTTIRNVGLPLGPRSMYPTNYYTMPHRGYRQQNRYNGNGLYGGRGNAGVPMYDTAPFPDPIPPHGRPDQGQAQAQAGVPPDYRGYTIGKEACGMVNIEVATERGGGETCNACSPGH